MPLFVWRGSERRVFPGVQRSDLSTLTLGPGEAVELDYDPGIPGLVQPEPDVPAPEPPVEPVAEQVAELQVEVAHLETEIPAEPEPAVETPPAF